MSVIINGKGTVGIRGGAVVGAPIITQFITTWKTDNAGTSTSTQISIPTTGAGYACSVDWGDGTSNSYSGTAPTMLHTYSVAGTYTVKISGTFPRILFNNAGDKLKLLTIENWGNIVWSGSMSNAFFGCNNLKINASDVPNFAAVTSTGYMFDSAGITSINLSGWNLSSCTNMASMFQRCNLLKDINVTNMVLNTTSNVDMSYMFQMIGLNGTLTGVTGMNTWDTSKVTTTANMFYGCIALKSIDLSNWNLTACTTTSSMFSYNSSLTGITGINTWNTSKVNSTSQMFNACSSLKDLNLSNWNMSANTSTGSMFNGCSSLSGLTGYENWDTRNVTTMASMFVTVKVPTFNLSNWNVGKVTTVSTMFDQVIATEINLSNWNLSACTNFTYLVYRTSNVKTVNTTGWNLNTTSNVDMTAMFIQNTGLTGITGINNWNTSKVTSTVSMFANCTSLSGITSLTSWNTSKVTNVYAMFASCTALQTLDLSGWNLSACTMYSNAYNLGMFYNCTGLKNLNVSGWTLNTTSNYSMDSMFRSCTGLSAITGFNTWNTSKVNYVGDIFYGCSSLQTLDLSGWNLSASTYNTNMFYGCSSLKSVNTTGWVLNTTTNTPMGNLFYGCTALTGVTGIKNWNMSKVTNIQSLFYGCAALQSIDVSGWNLSACTVFTNGYNLGAFASSGLRDINVSNWILPSSTGVTVTSGMYGMFAYSSSLSAITGLDTWNMSRMNSTGYMFASLPLIKDLNLSNWNLSACTDFSVMFAACSSLTGLSVSNWVLPTSTGTSINMSTMFQNMGYTPIKTITGLNTWNITRVTNFNSFLLGTTLDTTTYSNMLIAWDILDPVNSLAFNGGGSKYNAAGQVARASLVTNDLWSITDGGLA